jgi:hypothetical protein
LLLLFLLQQFFFGFSAFGLGQDKGFRRSGFRRGYRSISKCECRKGRRSDQQAQSGARQNPGLAFH